MIEITPSSSTLGADRPSIGIDSYPLHPLQVDNYPIIVGTETGNTVPAAPDRQVKAALCCVSDTCDHVGVVDRSDHHRRPLIYHGVVDRASLLIALVPVCKDLAPYLFQQ